MLDSVTTQKTTNPVFIPVETSNIASVLQRLELDLACAMVWIVVLLV
jgi:hypothetical protein